MKNHYINKAGERTGITRKRFLSAAAFGCLAAMAGVGPLATPVRADDGDRYYTFVALSQADTVNGVIHRIWMAGDGRFNPLEGKVKGGGRFLHYDQAPPIPKPIIDSGTWQATRFISYQALTPPGIAGHFEAGILEMEVRLHLDDGSEISGVLLHVTCNIGFEGFVTGEPEGYRLTIPGAPYGTFAPIVVALAGGGTTTLGLTALSIAEAD